MFSPAIIDWCRNCAQYARPADINTSNDDLWTIVLVLAIVVLILWIISWLIGRGRGV